MRIHLNRDSDDRDETGDRPRQDAAPAPETAGAGDDRAAAKAAPPMAAPGAAADELAQLRRKADERDALWDRLIRTQADFENWRKRLERESHATARFALQEFVQELLPVLDNLQRALAAAGGGNAEEAGSFLEGVRLVEKQLRDVLAANDVEPIPSVGQKFDPEVHEAVAVVHTAEHPPFTILEEVQPGFRLHERIVRPARVIVAASPENADAGGAPADDSDRG